MKYLKHGRGPGTAFVFRMRTPSALIGVADPQTGKPFGKWIERGTGTRNPAKARRFRDILLGRLRELEGVASGAQVDPRWSTERAFASAEEIQRQEREGFEPDDDRVDIRGVLLDEIDRARSLPSSRRPPEETLTRFAQIALRGALPLTDALEQYLSERAPDNVRGFKALSPSTVRDIRTAVTYFTDFLGEGACLQDPTPEDVRRFRYDYLPSQRSPRSPAGLSAKTAEKHCSHLRGIWRWAAARGLISDEDGRKWEMVRGVPIQKPGREDGRRTFTADEVTTLLTAHKRGTRMGDIIRLALVTGCRANELASLLRSDVDHDASAFRVRTGKTANAARYVPLGEAAQALLQERLAQHAPADRVFPDWPLRPSTGVASALPQMFTRERRKLLGDETNDMLTFHSLRHNWRTAARHAGISEADWNALGGWAGVRTSSSGYDHGQLELKLREAQAKVTQVLEEQGFLAKF